MQCEDCQKWRRLSRGSQRVKDGDAWFCALDASLAGKLLGTPEAWGEALSISEGFCHRLGRQLRMRVRWVSRSTLRTHRQLPTPLRRKATA